tara:strand:- start:133 stop:474 length:342 start_codon:yes stop_codon:yes gene_type:complete
MNIEPLKTLLKDSNDKKNTIIYFLNDDIKNKLNKYLFEEENFYINERVIAIKKNTLEFEANGRIVCIDDDILTLKLNNVRNINININDYYLFIKPKKKDLEKREFMKQLLEKL